MIRRNICNHLYDWTVDAYATTSAHGAVRFATVYERNQNNIEHPEEITKFNYNVNKLNKKKSVEGLILPQLVGNCNLTELTNNL